jgi:hypothetical protein
MTLDDNPLETNEDLQRFITELQSKQNTQNQSSSNAEKNTPDATNNINDTLDSSQSDDSLRSGSSKRESTSEAKENKGIGESSKSENPELGKQFNTLNPELIALDSKTKNEQYSQFNLNNPDHILENHLNKNDEKALTEDDIQRLEQQLSSQAQQLQSINLLSGLPQDGIFAPDGKSIYEMEPATLNAYLLQLKSSGQNTVASEVQDAYTHAVNRLQNYISQKTLINQKQDTLREKRHFNEWRQVRDEWVSRFPEVDTHLDQLAHYIEKKAASDPIFEVQLASQAGKMRAVLQGIQDLGIDKKLAAQEPRMKISIPASPESLKASKKVSNQTGMPEAFTAEQISKMSMQEYLKHEADIDKQLAQKLIK